MAASLLWKLLLLKILADIQGRRTSWKPEFHSNSGKAARLHQVTSQRQEPLPHGEQGHPPKPLQTPSAAWLTPSPAEAVHSPPLISDSFAVPCSSPSTAKPREQTRLKKKIKISLLQPSRWQRQLEVSAGSKCWKLTSAELLPLSQTTPSPYMLH